MRCMVIIVAANLLFTGAKVRSKRMMEISLRERSGAFVGLVVGLVNYGVIIRSSSIL